MDHDKVSNAPVKYGIYILVWLSLLIFTGLTVGIAGLELRSLAVVAALVIACCKTFLVVSYFMHLKYEDRTFRIMFIFAILILAVILFLTYTDTWYR